MKPDVLILLAKPGDLVFDEEGWRHAGRALRYEVGRHTARSLEDLARLLQPYERNGAATIDPRKGVTVQDSIQVMDLLRRLGFDEVVFAGTTENDW